MKKMMRMLYVLVCIIGMTAVHAAGVYADLYVTNHGEVKSINVYSDTGDTLLKTITSDALTDPQGIAVDASFIYVADRATNSILVFNLTDTGNVTPRKISGTETGLNSPVGIAVDASKIYVANAVYDSDNNVFTYSKITAYKLGDDSNASPQLTIDTNLNGPCGIAVNEANIYVANAGDNTVSVFNKTSGSLVQTISSGGLEVPFGIAVDADFIYVANYGGTSICTFNLKDNGVGLTPLTKISGTTNAKLVSPYGITVDATYIYLADNGSSDAIPVFKLTDTGDVKPQRVIGGLNGPVFIAKNLSPPAGLTATPASSTQINLTWTDNSSDETGFRIFRNGVELTPSPKAAANAIIFNDTGLTCNTPYTYTVKATNSAGDSAAATTTITTSACVAPAAPTSLTATPASSTQINLTWIDNSSGAAQFKIYRGTTLVTTTAAGATSYEDIGLTCNTPYTYTVKATDSGGDSAAAATTPATITTSACTAAYSSTPVAGAIPAMTTTVGTNPTTTLTVNNTGTVDMTVTEITFGGTDPGKFSVSPNTFPVSITATGTQAFTISCNASVAGTYSATMAVAHNATGSPANYTLSCTVACTPTSCIPGDVNGDGSVDLNDALHVLRILDGIPVDKINLNADVNGDHKIGLEELGYILQKVAGLRPSGA
ncbi:MAG: hypothetical protein BWK80_49415 [Desulfobacteraceae bacterium IS3]|nr:MAG: hypothetical protein BWK80_49415 [Desulfobacteraceae bacterium IS3]